MGTQRTRMSGAAPDVPHDIETICAHPGRLLWVTVGGVAIAEGLFELLLCWRPAMSPQIEAILDAGFIGEMADEGNGPPGAQ